MEKDNKLTLLAKDLNSEVFKVISAETLAGFEKAFLIAAAAGLLKDKLTPEYMKPIMELQGNRLGFKTDKDLAQGGGKGTGYPVEVVKNCLIEAVLTGVQPFGNQFNIIAGNCYITKEGFGYLLKNFKGLSYDITPEIPKINADKSGATIVMDINWTISGVTKNKKIDISVKMNAYMGSDAVVGKATRKARAWLFNTITGSEIADGDAADNDAVKTIHIIPEEISFEELSELFEAKKEALTKGELTAATRVLEGKETNSYKKLQDLLKSK